MFLKEKTKQTKLSQRNPNKAISAIYWESETPGIRTVLIIPLNGWVFFSLKPWVFLGFFGRSFCAGRELQRPKSNHVHTAFSCFFLHFPPPQKGHENPRFPLRPCPDDRAQNSVQDSINESSVRPNPTLVFAKILFKFCHF